MTDEDARELKESIAAIRREIDLRAQFQEDLAEQLRQTSDRTAIQMDKRLESMNEFREQLRMQAATYWTRHEHEQFSARIDQEFRNINQKLDIIQSRQDQDAGRRTVLTAIGTAIASVLTGSMVGIILLVLTNSARIGH